MRTSSPDLYRRLRAVLVEQAWSYELILVNDCSPDESWECMVKISARDPHVKALLLRKNAGYDCAVMAGLRVATMPLIVTMDDDLQHAPEHLPRLVEEIDKGADVVYAQFGRLKQSFIKNLGSRLVGRLAEVALSKPKGIQISAFKIFRKEIVDEMIRYEGPFPYVDGLIFHTTSAIGQIPLEHSERFSGEGHYGFLKSFRIVASFCTTFSVLPLRVSSFLGIGISALAGLMGVLLVVAWLIFEIDVAGWTSVMVTILFLGGFQLLALGVVGEYLGRAYMNLNRRPQYVVKTVRQSFVPTAEEPAVLEVHQGAEGA